MKEIKAYVGPDEKQAAGTFLCFKKMRIKLFIAVLGVGMLLTGCNHFGGSGCGEAVRAPGRPATVYDSPHQH